MECMGPTDTQCKLVGNQPGNFLPLNLGLIIDSFDGEEDLSQRMCVRYVELPLVCELSAILNQRGGNTVI